MIVDLDPVEETPWFYDKIEYDLKKLFRQEIYVPMLQRFYVKEQDINSTKMDLGEALKIGRISYHNGIFKGKFNALITKELRSYGAVWDRQENGFRLSVLSVALRQKLKKAEDFFELKIKFVEDYLNSLEKENFSQKLKLISVFYLYLIKIEKDLKINLSKYVKPRQRSDDEKKYIASLWQKEIQERVQETIEKEVERIRVFLKTVASNDVPYNSLIKEIEKSFERSLNRARVYAQDEVRFLVSKHIQYEYMSLGLMEYRWNCVNMPHDKPPPAPHILGNVRYSHSILNKTIQRWDNPPITTNPGEPVRHCNVGQDYGCRCYPTPVYKI